MTELEKLLAIQKLINQLVDLQSLVTPITANADSVRQQLNDLYEKAENDSFVFGEKSQDAFDLGIQFGQTLGQLNIAEQIQSILKA